MSARLSDPRILRSRGALEAALRELIAERDLREISVSDLTKRARVDRSTFYEHYADVDDLAAAACTAVFDELIAAASDAGERRGDQLDPSASLASLFGHVAEHAALYRTLLGDRGSARVINHLLQRVADSARSRIAESAVPGDAGSEHAADPARAIGDPFPVFVAGAVIGTIVDWLRRDCPGTPEQMSAVVWPYLYASASTRTGTATPVRAGTSTGTGA